MADDFPDDSLFRNSNVAYFEEALRNKENSVKGLIYLKDGEHCKTSRSLNISEDLKNSINLKSHTEKLLNVASKNELKQLVEHEEKCPTGQNDLSSGSKEMDSLHFTTARKVYEATCVPSACPLSEQNPPALQESSSDENDSAPTDKLKSMPLTDKLKPLPLKEKSLSKKPSRLKRTQNRSDVELEQPSVSDNLSKKSCSKTTRPARSKNKLVNVKAGEDSVKQVQNIKKKGYQPLQLNITRNTKHEDANCQNTKNPFPESQSIPKLGADSFKERSDIRSSTISAENSALNETGRTETDETYCDDTLLTTQQRLQLESWGFPDTILKQYALRGVTQMFPWQVECLCSPNVLNGGNLIYSAPTSAGKTLVAEILCIKTVLERKKKAIFILPFVSVVREKMFYFQDLLGSTGIRVEGFMGGHSPPGGFRCLDIAVCTIEKANGIINRLLEDDGLSSLGAVVVDELHLLGDPFRGYLLELLLTKLRYMSKNTEEKHMELKLLFMQGHVPQTSIYPTYHSSLLHQTSIRLENTKRIYFSVMGCNA